MPVRSMHVPGLGPAQLPAISANAPSISLHGNHPEYHSGIYWLKGLVPTEKKEYSQHPPFPAGPAVRPPPTFPTWSISVDGSGMGYPIALGFQKLEQLILPDSLICPH